MQLVLVYADFMKRSRVGSLRGRRMVVLMLSTYLAGLWIGCAGTSLLVSLLLQSLLPEVGNVPSCIE